MSKNDVGLMALAAALADEMRIFGAETAELSSDNLKLGVRVTVKVKQIES